MVERSGTLIMIDDDRYPLFEPGEKPHEEMVRFRTLGCYPLTGGIRSDASDLPSIIMEMQASRTSEREGRLDRLRSGRLDGEEEAGGVFLIERLRRPSAPPTPISTSGSRSRPKRACCAS